MWHLGHCIEKPCAFWSPLHTVANAWCIWQHSQGHCVTKELPSVVNYGIWNGKVNGQLHWKSHCVLHRYQDCPCFWLKGRNTKKKKVPDSTMTFIYIWVLYHFSFGSWNKSGSNMLAVPSVLNTLYMLSTSRLLEAALGQNTPASISVLFFVFFFLLFSQGEIYNKFQWKLLIQITTSRSWFSHV